MKHWKKPAGVNAAIIVALLLIDLAMGGSGDAYVPRFAFTGIITLLLAPVNLVIGMVRNRNKKGDGPVYLLISGLLLLVGFSVCTIP